VPVTEPHAVPAATPVAESVLPDHPAPQPAPVVIEEPPPKAEAPKLEPATAAPAASPATPPDHSEAPKP
jgi:hypothetical protein